MSIISPNGRMFQWCIFLHCNEAVASRTKALPPHSLVPAGMREEKIFMIKQNCWMRLDGPQAAYIPGQIPA